MEEKAILHHKMVAMPPLLPTLLWVPFRELYTFSWTNRLWTWLFSIALPTRHLLSNSYGSFFPWVETPAEFQITFSLTNFYFKTSFFSAFCWLLELTESLLIRASFLVLTILTVGPPLKKSLSFLNSWNTYNYTKFTNINIIKEQLPFFGNTSYSPTPNNSSYSQANILRMMFLKSVHFVSVLCQDKELVY